MLNSDDMFPSENNLDLIWLAVSLRVMFLHIFTHAIGIDADNNLLMRIFSLVPGVPIFFFLSGFLISRSYLRAPSLRGFYHARFLRVYPGLWFSITFGIFLAWASGYFSTISVGIASFLTWVLAQGTFLQFYNPDFMRDYGVGVVNGSLWTLSVQIQFYLLTPLLMRLSAHPKWFF